MKILAIDASNIRAGGGVTHIVKLLNQHHPKKSDFQKIFIWGPSYTLKKIRRQPWLHKITSPLLDKSLFFIIIWQLFFRRTILKKHRFDLLFVVSGHYTGSFRPFVTMCQNLLVFEAKEQKRFGASWTRCKLKILNILQRYTFSRAAGLIHLSCYAQKTVCQQLKNIPKQTVIYHGASEEHKINPKKQKHIQEYSADRRFKLLYVSTVSVYKHQWNVVYAVKKLIEKGYNIELHLVGNSTSAGLRKLNQAMQPKSYYIHYHGAVPHHDIWKFYHNADGFIFASTCESISIILIEAMSAGLPIICSHYGPMPEIAKGSLSFDPTSIDSTTQQLENFLNNKEQRKKLAHLMNQNALNYSWKKCSQQTFSFLLSCLPKKTRNL